ncbi:universal stress protein [Halosimplex amylolyticum]|uniref:universal stress protein n=1 Tax=Halosimplex amylolyticum TaxID=3396616 RepID=UPI003F572512
MTLVVPFDGSPLAEAALVRADQFGTVFDEAVLAVTVVPADNARYARERGWIDDDERFDLSTVASRLREQVRELSPDAEFRRCVVDSYAPTGTIAKRVRELAKAVDASMVFVGSENAGRLVTGISSVGGAIATDVAYDVVIVRQSGPAKVAALREASASGASGSGNSPAE